MNQVNSQAFRAYAAASGEQIAPEFSVTPIEQVDKICAAAEAAFDAYQGISSERRAAFLEAIAEEIMAIGDELLERAHVESGLPMTHLTGERGRTVNQLKICAEVVCADRWRGVRIDPAMSDRQPMPRSDLRMRMIPLGPVAVFGASNFPLAFSTAGGDTPSALGNGLSGGGEGPSRASRYRYAGCRGHSARGQGNGNAGRRVRPCSRTRQRIGRGTGPQQAHRSRMFHGFARRRSGPFSDRAAV